MHVEVETSEPRPATQETEIIAAQHRRAESVTSELLTAIAEARKILRRTRELLAEISNTSSDRGTQSY